MSLTASMWSSVSGLLVHGEKMNVIGNNIANINTLAFKGQRMDFQDFIYQDGFSAAGPTQIGRGAGINAVLGDFSQGSFETTNDPMDLAIGGKGFFQVKDPYSEQVWYTRAGNFRFDYDGYLRNPQGYTLQGWKIDNSSSPTIATGATPTVTAKSPIQGTGVPVDILLDTWTVPPKQTTKWDMTLNLKASSGNDKTSSTTNPFFALSQRWNGTQPPNPPGSSPLSTDAYSYANPIKVYDEAGTAHTLTTYFDQVTTNQTPTLRAAASRLDGAAAAGTFTIFGTEGPTGVTYTQALTAINGVLGGLGTQTRVTTPPGDLPIMQLPSGAWCFDLSKATQANFQITNDGGTTWVAASNAQAQAAITAIENHATLKTYCAFGPASLADPLDTTGKITNLPNGYKMYEYLVTMDPAEDMRTFGGRYNSVTGLLEDDPGNLTGPIAASAGSFNAATKLAANNYATPPMTYAAAVAVVQGVLAGVAAPTAVGIVQWPSGAWALDPNDPYVAMAAAINPGLIDPLTTVTAPAIIPAADQNLIRKFNETPAGGILMRGTITFNSSGDIVNQTAYSYMGNTSLGPNQTYSANPANLASWEPTAVSSSGYPVFTPNFTGQPMANSVRQTASNDRPDASKYLIELNFGFKCVGNLDQPWGPQPLPNAANAGTDYSDLANMTDGKKNDSSTQMLGTTNVTRNNSQDGYTSGDLSNTSVDEKGVIYGIYSNGVTMPLYQITLYNFVDPQGLRREGGNLFSATRDSGNPQVAPAGQNGMGSVNSYSIEQSNVDMAREFVQMITTQRGFQANSKGVTTVDQMLETVIGMKR